MNTTSPAEGCTVPLRLRCYPHVDDVQLPPNLLDQGLILFYTQTRSVGAHLQRSPCLLLCHKTDK